MKFSILQMLREKYLPMLGKFVHMSFSYTISSKGKRIRPKVQSIDAYGHVTRVEDAHLLFKDNDNFEYIVELNKIYDCTLAGRRRTVREFQQLKHKTK